MDSDSEKNSKDQLSISENVESNNLLELKKLETQLEIKKLELKKLEQQTELKKLELEQQQTELKKLELEEKNIGINYLINILNNNNIFIKVIMVKRDKNDKKVYNFKIKKHEPYLDQILIQFNSFIQLKQLSDFELRDYDDVVIHHNCYDYTLHKMPWHLSIKRVIKPESACYWDDGQLSGLSIDFQDIQNKEDFLNGFTVFPISKIALDFILSLEGFDSSIIGEFVQYKEKKNENITRFDSLKINKIIKVLCLSSKYPNTESLVNLFMTFLFDALGYYSDRLFAFPEFKHKIVFGNSDKINIKEAKPDFTIMDVFSYLRMVVVEDKSEENPDGETKVEAQLIAEAIAIYQANQSIDRSSLKRKNLDSDNDNDNNNSVFGVKVKGLTLQFFVIPISNQIISAMNTLIPSEQKTYVKKYGPFNFKIKSDRYTIIEMLDCFRQIVVVQGEKSIRRNSGLKNT